MRGRVNAFAITVAGCVLLPVVAAAEPTQQRQEDLRHLLRHDCGSCHGMTLKGGLGPPLLPANLRDKDRGALHDTIQHGRPGTPMPPWRGQLTDDETAWLVRLLVKGTRP